MSQRAFEAALGRLICDDSFRQDFFEEPENTIVTAGYLLTPPELSSLCNASFEAVESLAAHLDERVRRAEEPHARRVPKRAGGDPIRNGGMR